MSSVTPYVMVDSASAFSKFIQSAFEAEVAYMVPLPSDPERVIHAEARIGSSVLFFADSGPDGGRCLRSPSEPVHIQLWTTVPDAEAAYLRAIAAGARSALEVTSQADGSRMGGFVDPFGTLWWVSTPPELEPEGEQCMSAVRLLVLGAVRRRGKAHGYQVRTDLESWGAHEWSNATSGSVYHALKAMAGQGLLHGHETTPSVAGGPPRVEYEVTEAGEQTYFDLLREALTSHDPRLDLLAAAVGLIDDLPRDQAIDLLRERTEVMNRWKASITAHLPANADLESWGPVGEVIGLWLHTAESRAEWTHRLLRRLETGAFQMADDKPGE